MSSEKSALFALSALRGDKGYAIGFLSTMIGKGD